MNTENIDNSDTNNETKWNKKNKLFSSENFVGSVLDSGQDIPDIERKIKKIYNRKKIKQCIQPLKNIYDPPCDDETEGFDVPSNENKCTECGDNDGDEDVQAEQFADYSQAYASPDINEDGVGGVGGDDSDDDVDDDDDDNPGEEGFQEGARGRKKKKKKSKKKSASGVFQKGVKYIKKGLDKSFEAIFFVNKLGKKGIDRASESITNTPALSGYENKKRDLQKKSDETPAEYKTRVAPIKKEMQDKQKDQESLAKIISMCVVYPLCIWFTYNWYYLIVYREEDKTRPNGDSDRFKIDLGNSVLNELFQYALYPLKTFDTYIFADEGLPDKIKDHSKYHVFYKLATLIFSIILVYHVGLTGDINSATKGVSAPIYYGVTFLVLFYFCISVFPKILEYMLQFGGIMVTGPLVGIFIITCIFFIMLGLCMMTIPLAILLFILFLWFHSLFGLFMYSKDRTLSENIREINIHVAESLAELDDKDPSTFKPNVIQRMLKSFSTFLFKHMYIFVYLGILIYNLIYATTNIISVQLKATISMLLLSVSGIFGVWVAGYMLEGSVPFIPGYVATHETVYGKK